MAPNHRKTARQSPIPCRAAYKSGGVILWAKKLVADAAFAFLFALVVALILASLSAAGIINLALANTLLVIAWIIGVISTFLLHHIMTPSHAHKIIFSTILAILLYLLGNFESQFQHTMKESSQVSALPTLNAIPASLGAPAVGPSRQHTTGIRIEGGSNISITGNYCGSGVDTCIEGINTSNLITSGNTFDPTGAKVPQIQAPISLPAALPPSPAQPAPPKKR